MFIEDLLHRRLSAPDIIDYAGLKWSCKGQGICERLLILTLLSTFNGNQISFMIIRSFSSFFIKSSLFLTLNFCYIFVRLDP